MPGGGARYLFFEPAARSLGAAAPGAVVLGESGVCESGSIVEAYHYFFERKVAVIIGYAHHL